MQTTSSPQGALAAPVTGAATTSRRRLPLAIVIALAILTAVVGAALIGPFLAGDPNAQSLTSALKPPMSVGADGQTHLLGTDQLGRDQLARVLSGTRTSLMVSFLALVIGGMVGTMVGMVSGYVGGRLDNILMRLVDVQLAVPGVLLVLTLAAALRPSMTTTIGVLALVVWVVYARVARAQVLSLRETDFIVAARATGCTNTSILLRHVLPNIAGPICVISTVEFGHVMIAEASLGYLGFGIPPPAPTLGSMISAGQGYLPLGIWWLVVVPGLVITATIVSTNAVGNWLRDILDPRSRRRG